MFLGNDVVDLYGEAERYHPRFPRRVLTDLEYQGYCRSRDPYRYLWTAWAAKEAAYKAISQSGAIQPFRPMAFEYRRHINAVSHNGQTIPIQECVAPDCIIAMARLGAGRYFTVTRTIDDVWGDDNHPRYERKSCGTSLASLAARHLVVTVLTSKLLCRPADIEIRKNQWGVPKLHVKGKPFAFGLSISHHGRYVSITIGYSEHFGSPVRRQRVVE